MKKSSIALFAAAALTTSAAALGKTTQDCDKKADAWIAEAQTTTLKNTDGNKSVSTEFVCKADGKEPTLYEVSASKTVSLVKTTTPTNG